LPVGLRKNGHDNYYLRFPRLQRQKSKGSGVIVSAPCLGVPAGAERRDFRIGRRCCKCFGRRRSGGLRVLNRTGWERKPFGRKRCRFSGPPDIHWRLPGPYGPGYFLALLRSWFCQGVLVFRF
jgi:hypothetical protein